MQTSQPARSHFRVVYLGDWTVDDGAYGYCSYIFKSVLPT